MKFEPVEVTWFTAVAPLQAKKIDLVFVLDATPKCTVAVNFPPNLYCIMCWLCLLMMT